MSIEDIMSRDVITVGMDDDLTRVKQIFDSHRFHHLIVLELERVVGVISDRDLLRNISPFLDKAAERTQDLDTLKRKVHQIMSRRPITVEGSKSLCEAADVMITKRVSCLPVVDEAGKLRGIVTWRDLLRSVCPVEHG